MVCGLDIIVHLFWVPAGIPDVSEGLFQPRDPWLCPLTPQAHCGMQWRPAEEEVLGRAVER